LAALQGVIISIVLLVVIFVVVLVVAEVVAWVFRKRKKKVKLPSGIPVGIALLIFGLFLSAAFWPLFGIAGKGVTYKEALDYEARGEFPSHAPGEAFNFRDRISRIGPVVQKNGTDVVYVWFGSVEETNDTSRAMAFVPSVATKYAPGDYVLVLDEISTESNVSSKEVLKTHLAYQVGGDYLIYPYWYVDSLFWLLSIIGLADLAFGLVAYRRNIREQKEKERKEQEANVQPTPPRPPKAP